MVGGRMPTCSSRRTEAAHRAWGSGWAKDDSAFSAVLGFTDPQRLSPRIEQHVTPAQFKNLACTHACLAEKRENELVRRGRPGDGGIQCPLLMLLADWSWGGPPAAQRRQRHQRTVCAQAAPDRPGEQVAESGDAATDGAGCRFAPNEPGLKVHLVEL